jgi:LPXTG-motif cell wall-anchored protein
MLKKRVLMTIGAALSTISLAVFIPSGASASSNTIYEVTDMEFGFAPGDTIDITITPGDYALEDFCYSSTYENVITQTQPGFSVAAYITDGAAYKLLFGIQDGVGNGTGSFTPSSQTTPLTVSMTLPTNAAEGTWTFGVQCIGPNFPYYRWDSNGGNELAFFIVEASSTPVPTPVPTDPGSGDSGEPATAANETLPATGANDGAGFWLATVASALVAMGIGVTFLRRRRS